MKDSTWRGRLEGAAVIAVMAAVLFVVANQDFTAVEDQLPSETLQEKYERKRSDDPPNLDEIVETPPPEDLLEEVEEEAGEENP